VELALCLATIFNWIEHVLLCFKSHNQTNT
jgi:hypothetical protein